MGAKKKPKKRKKPPTYVSKRIQELAPEFDWDPKSIEQIVRKGSKS